MVVTPPGMIAISVFPSLKSVVHFVVEVSPEVVKDKKIL
jgi:hypothetical protein